jgi:hypothetical protein
MISTRSRYTRDHVVRLEGRGGLMRNTIFPRAPKPLVFSYTPYQWVSGDRVDGLAKFYFGDETMWWIVADANPEIMVWDEVSPGTIIRIPNV